MTQMRCLTGPLILTLSNGIVLREALLHVIVFVSGISFFFSLVRDNLNIEI